MLIFTRKKTVYLKDLFEEDHVDMHSHLLPGIDDGAKTTEDTVKLIDGFKELGIRHIITTPHIIQGVWPNTSGIIREKEQEIRPHAERQVSSFRAAAEYLMDESFRELVRERDILCLKDKYVLVEMSYISPPISLFDILFDLQVAGYTPVLAHPERYLFYHENFDMYAKLKKAGCLLQLNLLSLSSYYGREVHKTAMKLLREGLLDFVGTDAHNSRHIEYLKRKFRIEAPEILRELISNNKAVFAP
ncbi:tyrosine-protein phosphatase [Sinomicrobium soli]|uniref:tyrosine-protein phosphatase n=1 Tax=Sinomicrobium sp. N-1-3-6 TaxID=2219864 RepID=UPI000DCB4D09|nr:CpsB/CapC family capsule biosynthesis tyrosine phosphatase [Sinomicrobium sp. N-1-3-6]RAV30736.1 histidinol phosphatase [Sinomicrobium sp. N-1-3-6]